MTETNQQELTDLIANTYASEFHDPAGHAARAILQRHAEALLTERNEALREAAVAVEVIRERVETEYGDYHEYAPEWQGLVDAIDAIHALAEGGE